MIGTHCNRCGARLAQGRFGEQLCPICGFEDYAGDKGAPGTAVSSMVGDYTIPPEYRYIGVRKLMFKIQNPESV